MANELPSIDGSPIRVIAAVMIHDDIVAEGTASSGRYAKLKASSNALDALKGVAPFEYRMRYQCDCSEGNANGNGTGGGELPRREEVEELVGSAI